MPNHLPARRSAALLLTIGTGAMLGGCVAAIVPIAAGGLVGKKALIGGRHHEQQPTVTVETADTRPVPAAAPSPPPPPRRDVAKPAAQAAPRLADVRAADLADAPPPPSPPSPPAEPTGTTTTWDGIARAMAKSAARVADPLKTDVLQPPQDGKPVLCGARPVAVAIDAATLGSGDYLYVGALYTMGYTVVLMSPLKELPPGQVAALKKQGVAAPVRGTTLFSSFPGSERTTRLAMAKQYCVVGLVGDHAGDFPNSVLPGTPEARDGWFLVRR